MKQQRRLVWQQAAVCTSQHVLAVQTSPLRSLQSTCLCCSSRRALQPPPAEPQPGGLRDGDTWLSSKVALGHVSIRVAEIPTTYPSWTPNIAVTPVSGLTKEDADRLEKKSVSLKENVGTVLGFLLVLMAAELFAANQDDQDTCCERCSSNQTWDICNSCELPRKEEDV